MDNVRYMPVLRHSQAERVEDHFITLTEKLGDGVLVGGDDMGLGLVDIRYLNSEGVVSEQISLEPEKALRLAEVLAKCARDVLAVRETSMAGTDSGRAR